MTESTSPEVASIAARLLKHDDPEVRIIAASCLTQVEDKPAEEPDEEPWAVDLVRTAATVISRTTPDAVPAAMEAMREYADRGGPPGQESALAYLFRWLRGEE